MTRVGDRSPPIVTAFNTRRHATTRFRPAFCESSFRFEPGEYSAGTICAPAQRR